MSDDAEEWMTPAGAAAVLRRSERQIRSYAASGKVRSRRRGPSGRVEYFAPDVHALAAELGSARDVPRVEVAEIVPSYALAQQVERLHAELLAAQDRAARAETMLRLLPPVEEAQALRAERDAARAQAEGLRAQLAQAQGAGSMAWRLALVALLVALVAVGAVVALALVR